MDPEMAVKLREGQSHVPHMFAYYLGLSKHKPKGNGRVLDYMGGSMSAHDFDAIDPLYKEWFHTPMEMTYADSSFGTMGVIQHRVGLNAFFAESKKGEIHLHVPNNGLVVMRNAPIELEYPSFPTIMRSVYEATDLDGTLMVTHQTQRGIEKLQKIVEESGFTQIVCESNAMPAAKYTTNGTGTKIRQDGYVLMARKER